jgi:hypothetical protein
MRVENSSLILLTRCRPKLRGCSREAWYARPPLCFARKVCHFAMRGLPLGLQETASGVWERSTGRDGKAI